MTKDNAYGMIDLTKGSVQSGGGGGWLRSAGMWDMASDRPSLFGMLAMRMRWHTGFPYGSGLFDLHVSGLKTKVLVFVVIDENYVVLEDDVSLFPSDNLITKLRAMLP